MEGISIHNRRTNFVSLLKRASIVLIMILLLVSVLPIPKTEAKDETITVVSPNGGSTYTAGSVRKLAWSVSGDTGYIGISYSIDGGKSYVGIDAVENNPSHGYGFYDWTIPPTVESENCKIQVVWVSSLLKPYTIYASDESDDNFTIEKGVTITITEVPDSVSYGAYYFLKWTMFDPDGLVEGLKFEWRTNDGSGWSSWGSIASYYDWYDPGAGYIWWTPPHFESGNAEIRINAYSAGNVTLLDQVSTGSFTIISPNVFLINPNGGVTMVAGSSYTVEWRTSDDPDEVIGGVWIHYTTNDGGSWNLLHMGDNDFSETITVPSISTTNFKIRIRTIYSEFSIYGEDISDFGNTIISSSSIPSITLDFPHPPIAGGFIVTAGAQIDIEWSMTGSSSMSFLSILLSTDNGTSYTSIVNYGGVPSGPYTWTVPNVESFEAKIKVQATSISHGTIKGESIHPFYIVDPATFGNIPPIADAVQEYNVMEGTLVTMDASASYDPNGDFMVYTWKLVSPDREVILNNAGTATPSFTPSIEDYQVNFVFELRISDLKEFEGEWLYNVTRVSVAVTPSPPDLISFTPDTGWKGTDVHLTGTNMMGAEILIGEEVVGMIPRAPNGNHPDPDNQYTFPIPRNLPNGSHTITIRTGISEDESVDEIEIYPEPTFNYDYGISFGNNHTNHYSYPANPAHTGHYKDTFGNQIYINIWVCIGIPVYIPFHGWECLGYEIDEPICPEPLAAILYGAVFDDIGKKGECFGMSTAVLEYYHGRKDHTDFDQDVDFWQELERSGDFKRYIQVSQGSQISAEILHAYLGTLINGLVPSSDYSGMGVFIDLVKHSIDTGELGIMSLIDGGGHAVVPYAYEDRGGKTYFYVYDCNREYHCNPEDSNNAAQSYSDENDNPPVVVIDRSGTYWDWSFDFGKDTVWGDNIGIGFVPYSTVVGDRTLPTTIEGIINLIMGSATMEIEGEGENRTGLDEDGNIIWEMEGGSPLPFFGGEGDLPGGFYMPSGNYTHTIRGTEEGTYNWSIINNGSSAFRINNAEVDEESNDTVEMTYPDGNPLLGEMIYSTEDDRKGYDAGIVHKYGPRFRTFDVLGAELSDDGEHGGQHSIKTTEECDGLVFTNMGGGPTTFDVLFTTNVMGEDAVNDTGVPGYGYVPSATRTGITVGPGETVIMRPSNWLDLNNSIIILEGETPPGPVSNLMIEEVGGVVEISWDAPGNDGGWPVFEYEVMRGTNPDDMVSIGSTNETSFIDDTAEKDVTYFYSIRAFNILGAGEFAPTMNITIPLITEPGIPANLIGELVEGEIILTWDPPEDDGGEEITTYVIFRGTTAGDLSLLLEKNGTGYVDTGIETNMTYYYQVAAINSIGQGMFTQEVSVFVPADEPEPQDDDDDTDDDEPEDDNNWMLYLIIAIVVAILIIIIFVFVRGSNKDDLEE